MNILYPELEKLNLDVKYLVIDSKYGTHPWRFSIETFLNLSKNKIDVYYLSLITIDPSVFFGKSKLFLRRILYQNERHNYIKSVIDKNRIISTKFLLPKTKNLLNCFKVFFSVNPNKRLQIAIESWLSTKYGSTRYKKTWLTRLQSMRIASRYFRTIDLLKYIYSIDKFDVLITFNGRFPVDSAIVDYCNDNGIQNILFDGGSIAHDNFNKIQYFETSPHNEEEIRKKIDRYWEIGSENKVIEAQTAITSLINGERFVGNSFNWENLKYKNDLNNSKFSNLNLAKTVTFFASSDWEQGAINAWSPRIGFLNQFDMLISLAEVCHDFDFKLLIKPHPIKKNFKRDSNSKEFNSWKKFCESNGISAKIISQFDNLSTRILLTESAFIAGYGTSVLAQALYIGRPTIIGRKEPWINESNVRSLVKNEEQIRLIFREVGQSILKYEQNLTIRNSVLPWAYYRNVCGVDMLETSFLNGKLFVGPIQLDQKRRLYSYFLR